MRYNPILVCRADKTYATRAAFIDGFEFDWKGRRIPRKTAEITDPVQWLALEVTLQAVTGVSLPTDTTAVVIGNTMTGEVSRYVQLPPLPLVKRAAPSAPS